MVNVVCDLHATLLKGLKSSSDGGNIRKRENERRDVQTSYKPQCWKIVFIKLLTSTTFTERGHFS